MVEGVRTARRMRGVSDRLRVQLRAMHSRPRRVFAASLYCLRQDSALRRRVLLAAVGSAVVVIMLAAAIATDKALTSSGKAADRLAAAGDILVGATLLLAVIAALVAILAYAVLTGPPDLRLKVQFEFASANNPKFEAEIQEDGRLKARKFRQVFATVLLDNDSSYSAKSPGGHRSTPSDGFLAAARWIWEELENGRCSMAGPHQESGQ